MNSRNPRDTSKDPMPKAENFERDGHAGQTRHGRPQSGGNTPVTGESHNQGKSEKVSAASRDIKVSDKVGPSQPERGMGGGMSRHGRPKSGGNLPVSQAKEDHNQGKAQYVKASQRY